MRIYNVIMLFGIFGYQAICFGYNTNKTIVPIIVANEKQQQYEKASWSYLPSIATFGVGILTAKAWMGWYTNMCVGEKKFSWKNFKHENAQDYLLLSAVLSAITMVGAGLSYYVHAKTFPKSDMKLQQEKAKTKKI